MRSRILILLLLLAFFAAWLWRLGEPALTSDEAFVALLIEQPTGAIFERLNNDEPHPPGFYLLMHAWRQITGSHHELMVRYPSALLGMVLLSAVYALARALGFGRWGALAALVAVALNPQLMVHLREARMYPLMATSAALAALVAVRFTRLRLPLDVALAALASLLALFAHYFNALFVAAPGVWGLLVFRGPQRRRWIISQAIAVTALAIWLPLFGSGFFNPDSLSAGKTWATILPPWETLARLAQTGAFGYRDVPDSAWAWLGTVIVVGVWLAGAWLARREARWFLLLTAALPPAVFAVLGWFRPLFHAKYVAPWAIFAALGLGAILARSRRWGLAAALALAAVLLPPAWRTWSLPYDPGINVSADSHLDTGARDLAQGLMRFAGPEHVFGLRTPDPVNCFYTQRYFERDLGCALLPAYPDQPRAEVAQQLEALFAQHSVLWLMEFYNPSWDPGNVVAQALDEIALPLGSEDIAGRRLRLYTRPETVRAGQQPLNVRYNSERALAELSGVWITRGQNLYVVLHWRALAGGPAVNAKVFAHLLDASGVVLAQSDAVPVNGTRPLASWQAGEDILDVHLLRLPSELDLSGASLRIGLYDPETLKRLAAYEQTGARLPDDAAIAGLEPIR